MLTAVKFLSVNSFVTCTTVIVISENRFYNLLTVAKMKKNIFIVSIFILPFVLTSCFDETTSNVPEPEYVITWFAEENLNDPDWFKVINIRTNEFQAVPAVKELDGDYYLPIMSRMPSFDNKVVTGEFYMDQPFGSAKQDTVFRVTNHLRDTVVAGWGN